jgi:hypothetical protein
MMPDLIVTIHRSWLTIDGPLPESYRLLVHNHSGRPDFYHSSAFVGACDYVAGSGDEWDDAQSPGPCYLYIEESLSNLT